MLYILYADLVAAWGNKVMKLIAFGIHPDDIEIGCGGTVALAAEQGHSVTLVDLSDGAGSSNGTPAERADEAAEAARILGAAQRINLEKIPKLEKAFAREMHS